MDQNIFHCGAIELGQVLIELYIWKEPLLENINCFLLVAEWNGDLLLVEAFDIVP